MSERVPKMVFHLPRTKLVPVNLQAVHTLTLHHRPYPQHQVHALTLKLKQIERKPVILLDQIHYPLRPRTIRMTIAMLI
jgi:hypothetical protein